jgi:hypothetical protein
VIAEAVDAAVSVGWALLVWLLLLAVFATAALYTLVVTVWAVGRVIWRVLGGAWAAMGPRTDSLAPLAAEQPTEYPEPPRAAERTSAPPLRPAPSWARKDAA